MGKQVDEPYVFDFTHKNEAMSIDATKQMGTDTMRLTAEFTKFRNGYVQPPTTHT